jgi:homoserine kinase
MTIKIPCSTSNLGPGFDTLGLALNRYLFLTAEQSNGLSITVEGNGKDHIATDSSNLVYAAIETTAQKVGRTVPAMHLHIKNEVPAYGGLGGSGAAIAGGVVLANQLLNLRLSNDDMLNIAVEIEGHPDNVSAAIFGGLTINCFDAEKKVHCRSVKIADTLSVVACSPHFQVQTKQARKILPQQVSLKDAVTNIENAASLVAAMMSGDFDALRYTTAEKLHEQYRATLIPGFDDVKNAALNAGALSFNISGAGPTLFAFAINNENDIAEAMVRAFERNGQKATSEVMKIENNGAVLQSNI